MIRYRNVIPEGERAGTKTHRPLAERDNEGGEHDNDEEEDDLFGSEEEAADQSGEDEEPEGGALPNKSAMDINQAPAGATLSSTLARTFKMPLFDLLGQSVCRCDLERRGIGLYS